MTAADVRAAARARNEADRLAVQVHGAGAHVTLDRSLGGRPYVVRVYDAHHRCRLLTNGPTATEALASAVYAMRAEWEHLNGRDTR